jgi:cytochrome d ubiquinol oxidase subunit II
MILQNVWFFLWGLLWAVYFITDGFDLGLGTLLPFLARKDDQKRVIYNAMGPLWDGNEVWLLTAGGVTFAAFPMVYAVMFNSLYAPLMLLLFALILRGVAFEFRGKVDRPAWRALWDACMFLGSALPAILLGVAFANIFRGLPIIPGLVHQGPLLSLLNGYGLLGGLLFLLLFLQHGSLWLAIKSEGELHQRAVSTAGTIWPFVVLATVAFLVASFFATRLFDNYLRYPVLFLILAVAVLALVSIKLSLAKGSLWAAWFSSAVTIASTTFWGVIGLFPNMLPSSLHPAFSLTAHNASSSPLTLTIMLVVALIFVPIVLAYQIWVYTLFRGKVSPLDLHY